MYELYVGDAMCVCVVECMHEFLVGMLCVCVFACMHEYLVGMCVDGDDI